MEPKRPAKYMVSVLTPHLGTHRFEVGLESTVSNLKFSIESSLQIPFAYQRLLFHGKILEDNESFADVKIEPEQTIHLIVKSPPSFDQQELLFEDQPQLAENRSVSELGSRNPATNLPLENAVVDQLIQNIADTSGGRRNFRRTLTQQRTFGFLANKNESLEVLRQNMTTIECLIQTRTGLNSGSSFFQFLTSADKTMAGPWSFNGLSDRKPVYRLQNELPAINDVYKNVDSEENKLIPTSNYGGNQHMRKMIYSQTSNSQNFVREILFHEQKHFEIGEKNSAGQKKSAQIGELSTGNSLTKHSDRPIPLHNITNFNYRTHSQTKNSADLTVPKLQRPLPANIKIEIENQEEAFNFANRRFEIGQWIDVKDTIDKWLEAEVVKIARDAVKVHYRGWSEDWDEWIPISSKRIAFFRTHTAQNQECCYLSPAPSKSIDGNVPTGKSLQNSTKATFERGSHMIEEVLKMLKELTMTLEYLDKMKNPSTTFTLENRNGSDPEHSQSNLDMPNEFTNLINVDEMTSEKCYFKCIQPCLHSDVGEPTLRTEKLQQPLKGNEPTSIKRFDAAKSEASKKAQQLAPILDRVGRLMVDLAPHLAMIGTLVHYNQPNSLVDNFVGAAFEEYPKVSPLGLFSQNLKHSESANDSIDNRDGYVNPLSSYSSSIASTISQNDFSSRKPFLFQTPVMLHVGEIMLMNNSNPLLAPEGSVNLHINATVRNDRLPLKSRPSQTEASRHILDLIDGQDQWVIHVPDDFS